MAITFNYGTFQPALCPKLRISREPVQESRIDDAGTLKYGAFLERWDLEGQFFGNPDSLRTDLIDARAKLQLPDQDLVLKNGADVIAQVLASDAPGGIRPLAVDVPDIDRDELATVITYSAAIEAEIHDTSYADAWWSYVVDTVENYGTRLTRIRGLINGSEQGILDAYTALYAALSAGRVEVSESWSESSDKRSARFELQFADVTPEVFEWRESVELVLPTRHAVVRGLLSGSATPDAVIQTTAYKPAVLVESGEAKGRTNWPSFPISRLNGYPWADEPMMSKLPPEIVSGTSITAFPIRWRYAHVLPTTLDTEPPNPLVQGPSGPMEWNP